MLYWVPHCSIVFLKSPRPSLLIKRAALGNLKTSFHCAHWHRFFPLKKVFFYLSVSPARKDFFSKTYPSFLTVKEGFFLPLRLSCKESSTFSPSPSSSGSGDVTALRCSEPLRSKVGGPKRSSPYFAGWDRLGITCYNLL